MKAPSPSCARRIPQLDGLRGVAILLVVTSHALGGVYPHDRPLFPFVGPGWGGGFVGVQLFFVLSGFLLTAGLMGDRERTGRIDLLAFYGRRVRRLLPALTLACLAYAAYALFVLPGEERAGAWGAIARAATYTTNLDPLLPEGANSKWLNHTWSLAVEEQFYLGWPLALVLLLRRGRRSALAAALAGAVVAIAGRHVVSAIRPAHELMYYLMRWDALLIGCALALTPVHIRVGKITAGLGWAIMAVYLALPPAEIRPFDYTVTSLASAAVLLSAFDSKWLENRILGWFGMVSYGLYLWHLLLMRLDQPTWLAVATSVVVAYVSYRFIEFPILRGKR